jgi:hypothetical protein
MNERSPLLLNSINDENTKTSATKKRNFKWVALAHEDEQTRKDRFNSIRIGYIIMLMTSISFTISISSTWPFLQIVTITFKILEDCKLKFFSNFFD